MYIPPGPIATVEIGGLAPADATAAALTLESRNPSGPGYLTAFPCDGGRPMTSSINFVAGQRRAAQALVTFSAARTICIFSYDAAYVDIDIQGWFVGGERQPADRRRPDPAARHPRTGRKAVNVIQAPAGATAVAVSMVGLNSAVDASLTAWACDVPRPDSGPDPLRPRRDHRRRGVRPCLGRRHDLRGDVGACRCGGRPHRRVLLRRAAALHADGRAAHGRHREGLGGWLGRVAAGQSIDMQPAPPGAEAVSGTLTMVQPTISGWLRATPCGVSQLSSSANAPAGAILANSLTVALSADQRLCVEPYRGAHVLFDISGWWAP